MSFASNVGVQGAGVALRLEVSLDDFATTYARYSTHAGIEAGVDWDPRIISVGSIQRGLGEDHALRSSSVEVVLGNTDGACDWMVLPESSNSHKARFRLYVAVFTPSQLNSTGPAADDWQQQGEFKLNDRPRLTLDSVRFVLVDDVQGELAAGAPPLPTIYSALAADLSTPVPSPVYYSRFRAETVQLAWGGPGSLVQCRRAFWGVASSGPYHNMGAWVVCATSSTADVTANDVTEVRVELFGYPGVHTLPETWTDSDGNLQTLWAARKTAAKTVTGDDSGRSYRTLWISIDDAWFYEWMRSNFGFSKFDPADPTTGFEYGYQGGQVPWAGQNAIKSLAVLGYPFSARTNTGTKQRGTDVIADLCSYYYPRRAISVDAASKARVTAILNDDPAPCAGAIGGWAEGSKPKSYRQHISDIADSFDFDAFMGRNGAMKFSTANFDYTAITSIDSLPSIDETRIGDDFALQHPTREQRHAPFNRITNRNNEESVLRDFPSTQAEMGAILPRRITTIWRSGPLVGLAGVDFDTVGHDVYGGIRKTLRPFVELTTDLSALTLDVGDLLTLTFTGGGVRSWLTNAIHQIEDHTFIPEMNVVRLKLLWIDDLRSKRSYILDDENLLLRTDATATGASLTVTDGSANMTTGGAFLFGDTYGVEVGDIVILQDATEAADSFKRFRAIRILQVDQAGDGSLTVDASDLDFGAPTGVAVATWKIVRGHTTYKTAAEDAANYAQGGWLYGRISSFFGSGEPYQYSGNDQEVGFLIGHRMRRG